MNTYTYHNEFKILLAQVLNAFDELVIRRYNEQDDTTYTDKIAVRLLYAPKQRVLFDLVNKSQHIQLPVMAVSIAGISFQKERAFNKIAGFTVSQNILSGGGHFPQPIPVDINLNLSILTRYQRDFDQIITNILANFFPYIVISYKHPDLAQEVRCLVEWDGNLKISYPNDIAANTSYRILGDASFVVRGWIYRNASNPFGIIHTIPMTFTSVSALYDDYYAMHAMESDITTDTFTVSASGWS